MYKRQVPNIKASVLQNVDQTRARYPLLPTNYGRGRGGGRVIQQRDDGKSAAAIAAFGGNLTTAQRQIENQKEAIETLGRRVRVGEMRAGRDSRVISAFAFTNRQREIIDQIRDDETSATARNRLIRELSKDVDNRFKPTDLNPGAAAVRLGPEFTRDRRDLQYGLSTHNQDDAAQGDRFNTGAVVRRARKPHPPQSGQKIRQPCPRRRRADSRVQQGWIPAGWGFGAAQDLERRGWDSVAPVVEHGQSECGRQLHRAIV